MRVNLVPPSELTDQHLRAEHLEITLVADALRRTLLSLKGFQPHKVPPLFTLNSGHAYFFYNKGRWLHRRFILLTSEIHRRGFGATLQFPRHIWPDYLYLDWRPTYLDQTVSRVRIAERVMLKPEWYRYYRRPLTDQQLAVHHFYSSTYHSTFPSPDRNALTQYDVRAYLNERKIHVQRTSSNT